MAGIYFEARIDSDQLKKDIEQINRTLSNMTSNAEKAGNQMDNMFRGLAASVAAYFSFDFASQFITSIARMRGEFQQLEVAFETMLASKDKADKLMAQVVEFAAKTPFELKDVASGAKSLMAFGVTSEEIIPTLKALGDVSAGLSVPIERLILNFGQVKTQAQLTGRELRDFNIAGVPIVAELAKNLNRTEQEIQEMVTAGKIGFKEVSDAFRSMTDEGGRFANLMDKQAQTITGLQSNLRDAWNQMLNDIGKNSEGAIAGTIRAGISLVENYEKVIDILKILVATYGTYKAAVIAANVAMQTGNYPYIIMQIKAITTAINAATISWKAMATAQKATVVGLVAAGVTALISALTLLNRKTDEAAEFNTQLNNTYASEITSLNGVFDALKKTNEQTNERKDALKIINDRYGDYIDNLLTEKSTLQDIERAQKNATDAMIARITVMSSEGELQKQLGDISDKWNSRFGKFTEVYSQTFGADRLPEFIKAINEGVEQEIKSGEGIVKRGTLEYSKIAQDIYLQFIADISKKSGALQYTWDEFKTSFLDFAEYKAKKGGTLEYLQSLIEANKKLTTVITADDAQSTIKTQIESTTKALSDARIKLDQMRQSTSNATIDQITSQEQTIKDLETRLTALTGFSKKEADKQIKAEEEKLKALTELADREIELRNQTEAAKIAIMQDGADKQIKEAELAYKMELQAIEKYAADLLKTYNDAQLTKKLPTVQVLPQQYQAEIDAQTTVASKKFADEKIRIEKDAADRIKELWSVVADAFMNDQEREITAVNAKYQRMIDEAIKAGNIILATDLQSARQSEIDTINQNVALQRIDTEQEVADMTAEIERNKTQNQRKYEQQKLLIQIEYNNKRISELQKTVTKENQIEIERLNKLGEVLQSDLDRIKQEQLKSGIFEIFNQIVGLTGEIDEGLQNVLNTLGSVAENAYLVFMGFAKGGDVISGITGAIGILSTVFSLFKGNESATDKLRETLDRINTSLKVQGEILANLDGQSYYQLAKKQIEEYNAAIVTNTRLLSDYFYVTATGFNQLADIAEIGVQQYDEYGNEIGNTVDYVVYKNQYTVDQIVDMWSKGLIRLSQADADIVNQILANRQSVAYLLDETWQKATGSSRDTIADALIEGFKAGKTSAEDFADTFEELMTKAILNSIKIKIIEGPLIDFMESFSEMAKDGLDEGEVARARAFFNDLFTTSKQFWDNLTGVPGLEFLTKASGEKDTTLTGSVKSITEETAGLIAGQFMAMRTDLLGIHTDTTALKLYLAELSTSSLGPADLTALNTNAMELKSFAAEIASMALEQTHLLGIHTDTTALKAYAAEMSNMALDQMAVINQSVTYLAGIEKNTRDIALLRETNQKLTEMNTYLKNL